MKKLYVAPAILSGSKFERRGILAGCCLTDGGGGPSCSIEDQQSGPPFNTQTLICRDEDGDNDGPISGRSATSS
jgi:hypothetical protein